MTYTLLADSGSTKTDWALITDGTVAARIRTKGMNPFQMSEDEIANEVETALLPQLQSACGIGTASSKQDVTCTLSNLHFYGAGCTPEKIPVVAVISMSPVSAKWPATCSARREHSAVTSPASPAS